MNRKPAEVINLNAWALKAHVQTLSLEARIAARAFARARLDQLYGRANDPISVPAAAQCHRLTVKLIERWAYSQFGPPTGDHRSRW